MATVLTEFLNILVGGVTQMATGLAGGIVAMAKALFLEISVGEGGVETVTGLSIFGGVIAIFAGISLAVGITTRVYLWVTSLGH